MTPQRCISILSATVCLLTGIAFAGNLDPAGPPAPTMKTLDEVEPRIPISSPITISTPGSYYLTGPLVVNNNNFRIQSSNVTIDLEGFTVTGASNFGLILEDGVENVVVRNGGFEGFAFAAVTVSDLANVRFENLSLTGNVDGITLILSVTETIRGLFIEDCTIVDNSDRGIDFPSIRSGSSLYIRNNNVSRNGADGIYLNGSGTFSGAVTGNQCFANGATGLSAVTSLGSQLVYAKNVSGDNTGANYFNVPNVSTAAAAGAWDNITFP